MRGKAGLQSGFHGKPGITPAYAGKSHQLVNYIIDSKDHPRLCGEKEVNTCMHAGNFRITPAYAGKRAFMYIWQLGIGDHPRLCGEKAFDVFPNSAKKGSPPPMRGKAQHFLFFGVHRRITPAYAGKRICKLCQYFCVRDHPRLCGEKAVQHGVDGVLQGSPPPMRGKVPTA